MGRGRPKGSKNKPKEKVIASAEVIFSGNDKEIKSQIRKLRKLKKGLNAGCPERIDIGRKIKELKNQLGARQTENNSPEKQKLIDEILIKDDMANMLEKSFWNKFTVEQLQIHLNKLEEKRRIQ
jgi:predicted transcriptional regulator